MADIVTELLSPAEQASVPRSSARVLECLEVALAKLDREPAWRLAGSGYFDRTVGSMVAAILAEIEAFRADRPWLANGVEALQERLQQLTLLQAEEEARKVEGRRRSQLSPVGEVESRAARGGALPEN